MDRRLVIAIVVMLAALGVMIYIFIGKKPVDETAQPLAPVTVPADSTADANDMTEPTYAFPGILPDDKIQGKQVRISTAKGDIVIELYPDTAPMAVSNFVYLAGAGYYDSVVFHRRVEGFVIQGGDPLGSGRGGPGYKFNDELGDTRTYDRGIVAMANAGANTNGSQFFIMLDTFQSVSKTQPNYLGKNYTIFGRVIEGMDVADSIAIGDVMTKVAVESKP